MLRHGYNYPHKHKGQNCVCFCPWYDTVRWSDRIRMKYWRWRDREIIAAHIKRDEQKALALSIHRLECELGLSDEPYARMQARSASVPHWVTSQRTILETSLDKDYRS